VTQLYGIRELYGDIPLVKASPSRFAPDTHWGQNSKKKNSSRLSLHELHHSLQYISRTENPSSLAPIRTRPAVESLITPSHSLQFSKPLGFAPVSRHGLILRLQNEPWCKSATAASHLLRGVPPRSYQHVGPRVCGVRTSNVMVVIPLCVGASGRWGEGL